MKRLYLIILLAAVAICGMAQNVGDVMYIYLHDGQVNGFLPDEIQSIEYSYTDVDGNWYDEIVTQIVNTADSVYQIPLAEIDSISFITPKTEYQPGVINLSDQLMPYVVSSDELTITFSSSTPSSLIPRVGDKLVTLEMNEKFPAGFAGEVISVSGSQVTCKKVSLEEVFETYYGVSSTYGYQEGDNARLYDSHRAVNAFGNKDFKLGTFTWSRSSDLNSNIFGSSNLAMKGNAQLSIGITPTFHIVSTLIINKEEGTYFSACITGEMNFEEHLSAYGNVEWANDFLDNEWVKAPVAPLTYFYVKPGLFFRASATVSFSATFKQCYTFGAAFDFSSKKQSVIKPNCGGRLASSSSEVEGSIDGSVAVGGFVELGLTIVSSDIDKLCFRGELGAELVGHAVLYSSDVESAKRETKVYERFKSSSIALNAFVSTSVEAELGPWGVSYSLPWNLSHNIKTWDIVPTFSNTTFKQKDNPKTSADASVNMSGDCLFPVEVGLSVRKQNGDEAQGVFANTKFTNGNKQYQYTFANLNTSEDYTLYPKVKLFGYEMLASPSAKMEKKENEITVHTLSANNIEETSAKVAGCVDGYVAGQDDGEVGFCYNTIGNPSKSNGQSVSAGQLSNLSNGQFSSTLTGLEKGKTYYYCAYLYRDGKYQYGETLSFTSKKGNQADYTSCPDENHPHMIDLGLPSGTKWACCNVGASEPEDYGDYYAWGETQPKDEYSWETYAYWHDTNKDGFHDKREIVNIGSDIAGTSYDAATVNWGAAWGMPNLAQFQELQDNCTSFWTNQNGVNGREFLGPNGCTIFVPAAMRSGYGNNSESAGCYWSSIVGGTQYDAWWFTFGSESMYTIGESFSGNRPWGLTIRPVTCSTIPNGTEENSRTTLWEGEQVMDKNWPYIPIELSDVRTKVGEIKSGDKFVVTIVKADNSINTDWNYIPQVFIKLDWGEPALFSVKTVASGTTNVEITYSVGDEEATALVNGTQLEIQGMNIVVSKVEFVVGEHLEYETVGEDIAMDEWGQIYREQLTSYGQKDKITFSYRIEGSIEYQENGETKNVLDWIIGTINSLGGNVILADLPIKGIGEYSVSFQIKDIQTALNDTNTDYDTNGIGMYLWECKNAKGIRGNVKVYRVRK